MALLEIITYPATVLETPGELVTDFDEKLEKLVADMFETMEAARGVGLAAPQVNVSQRVFVMDCSGGRDPQQRLNVPRTARLPCQSQTQCYLKAANFRQRRFSSKHQRGCAACCDIHASIVSI